MIIKPNRRLKIPATRKNFPSCRFYFRCNETSGSVLNDDISGLVYAPTAGSLSFASGAAIITNGNSAINLSSVYDTSITNSPASKDFMLIALLSFPVANLGSKIYLGDGAIPSAGNDAIAITDSNAAGVVMSDAPQTASLTHSVNTGPSIHAVVGRWSGGTLNADYYVDAAAPVNASMAAAPPIVFGYTAATSKLLIQGGTLPINLFSLAYFSFTDANGIAPNDVTAGILYMKDRYNEEGVKELYPGWAGL